MNSGLVATIFPFLGADGAIHMSEEVKDARRNVPNALMASVTINGVLGIGMCIAILFTLGSLDDISSITSASVSGSPLVDYFVFVLDDNGFATGLTSLLVAMFIFACVAVLASTSRVTWAFARDNGMPGSHWIKKGMLEFLSSECIMLTIVKFTQEVIYLSGQLLYQQQSHCA